MAPVNTVLVSKICAAILLAIFRLGAGLLPLKVYRKLEKWSEKGDLKAVEKRTVNKRRQRVDLLLSIFLCFGAGLLLTTCFLHLIPEVRASIEKVVISGQYPVLSRFPFAEAIVILGFFAVYLFEEIGQLLVGTGKAKKKSKSLADEHPTLKMDPIPSRNEEELETGSSSQRTDVANTSAVQSQLGQDRIANKNAHNDASGQHGHSHGPPILDADAKSVAAAIRGFFLVFALSFHSIFEGMAIGLQPTLKDIWFLFTAVTIHELAIMFCIGLEMLTSSMRVKIYVAYMVTLGLITPIGVAIGIVITEYFKNPTPSHTLSIAILQGVAAGTLLYVTFLEVLERERGKPGNGLLKLVAVFAGFLLLSALEAFSGLEDQTVHLDMATGGSIQLMALQPNYPSNFPTDFQTNFQPNFQQNQPQYESIPLYKFYRPNA